MASANAIIFDLDGLLFDTDWLWAESERRVFSSLGATVTPDHQQQTAHLGTTLATRYWYDTFSLDQQKTPIEKAEAMVVKQVKEEIWRVATLLGGRELIQQALTLRTPIGLASNAPLSICHQALARFGPVECALATTKLLPPHEAALAAKSEVVV